jgi:hypothetical protein
VNYLNEKKQEGNELYAKQDYEGAIGVYNEAVKYINQTREFIAKYEEVRDKEVNLKFLKIQCILFSNSAQVEIKLENYPKSLICSSKAAKILKDIKKIVSNPEKYKNEYKQLEEKINQRRVVAWDHIPIQLFNYSNQPVPELRVGSVLEH